MLSAKKLHYSGRFWLRGDCPGKLNWCIFSGHTHTLLPPDTVQCALSALPSPSPDRSHSLYAYAQWSQSSSAMPPRCTLMKAQMSCPPTRTFS